MDGCNPDPNWGVCYYLGDNDDCKTSGCNSDSWAPKILNVKKTLEKVGGNDLAIYLMNRERLIIEVDKNESVWNLIMPTENDILTDGPLQGIPVELVGKQEYENKITWELKAEGC